MEEQVRPLARLVGGNCVARLPYCPCNNARPQSHQVLLDLHAASKYRAHIFVEEQQDADRKNSGSGAKSGTRCVSTSDQ